MAAALVGAALAVSGAIMQGITRNPIAEPGLLGINSGAGLALVLAYAFVPHLHYSHYSAVVVGFLPCSCFSIWTFLPN